MTDKKLSQITAAATLPALNDQLVSVQGGLTDLLYTLAQIQNAIVRQGIQDIPFAATLQGDGVHYQVFRVTLTGNAQLLVPSNPFPGVKYRWIIVQGSTGNHLLTYDTLFTWPNGNPPPTLATATDSTDIIEALYDGDNFHASSTSYPLILPALLLLNPTGTVSGSPTSSTCIQPVAAGTLVIAAVTADAPAQSTILTLVDSAGNIYTKAVESVAGTGQFNSSIWYATITNPLTTNDRFTATVSSTGTYGFRAMIAASLFNTLDKTATANNSGTGLSVSTGTLSASREIVVASFNWDSDPGPFTQGAGFTGISPSSPQQGLLAFQEVASTNSVTYAPSWVNASNTCAVIASFS